MDIQTSDISTIKPFFNKLYIPPSDSHKGHNGKVLIIGGSRLFHSASLWAAEVATHFADMVHYASTKENNEIFHTLKTTFRNGIIVEQKDIPYYIKEDDAILLGPGMVRDEDKNYELRITNYQSLLAIQNEAEFSRAMVYLVAKQFAHKRFVIDAGALQMMDAEWLPLFKETPIITPHQLEFERLFGVSVVDMPIDQKADIVKEYAAKYNCVILLKAVVDIISDGEQIAVVQGGNQGLTKGGSGDILAGVTAAFRSKNEAFVSAVVASYTEKSAADDLKKTKGYWYNMNDLIDQIPITFTQILRACKD